MYPAKFNSPDPQERLGAIKALNNNSALTPHDLQALLAALRDESHVVAGESARLLAQLGDRSVMPHLIEERRTLLASFTVTERQVDTTSKTVEPCLTMAIVWLQTPEQDQELLTRGTDFEKWLVQRKRTAASLDEYWGPLRS
jgi:hypothetical protein